MIRSLRNYLLLCCIGICCQVQAGDKVETKVNLGFSDLTVIGISEGFSSTPTDTGFGNDVLSITTFSGNLIVGGRFFTVGGTPSTRVGGWDGSVWYSMSGLPSGPEVYSLHVFNDELYAGTFLPTLYKWTGSGWVSVGADLAPQVDYGRIYAMETFNNELIIGGAFRFDTLQPPYIAKWNGATWDSLSNGIVGVVQDLIAFNGELVAGGLFSMASGSAGERIAKWNDTVWSPLGTGITGGPNPVIYAMTIFNGDLIAAGLFSDAGGQSVNNIARWNGNFWQSMGSGLNNTVNALIVNNNELIAAGAFTQSGGQIANYIAKWDGANWNQIGNEIDNAVYALGVYNGYLIAGGSFTNDGGYIALWDNINWVPVNSILTDVDDEGYSQRPVDFYLDQNYPNPFNPSTVIEFSLPHRSVIHIDVFNIRGQLVKQVINKTLTAGVHSVVWDGTDKAGDKVSSGVYFYRLSTDQYTLSKKMTLLK